MMEKVLLTGFGPFGPHAQNASGDAVRRLDGAAYEGFQVRGLVLPVQFERAVALLEEAIESEQPAAVICCGIHSDSPAEGFRLEVAAKNERHYGLPDVDGHLVHDACVVEGGPAMVFSSLPVGEIKRGIEAAGLPAQLSEDAGRFLCNAIFYWVASRVQPAGFLHVPTGPLPDVARAIEIAVEVTARRLSAQRVEATA